MFARIFDWFMAIDWTPEAVTAAATVTLACLTFVLAWGTVFLWRVTKRLVKGAERTAERQLRAYINYSKGSVVRWDSASPIVQAAFRNHGQPPAHNVVYRAAVRFRPIPFAGEMPHDSEIKPMT